MTSKKTVIRTVKESQGEQTTKDRQDDLMFKNDTLRKKYDLRNVDEKSINNIWLRAHIRQLKERSSNSSNA